MRALTRGERQASVGVIAGLIGVLMLLATSLFLTLAYRTQITELQSTIYTRCLERTRYDEANAKAVKASNELYRRILAQVQAAPQQPGMADARAEYVDTLTDAIDITDEAVANGTIGNCQQYRR